MTDQDDTQHPQHDPDGGDDVTVTDVDTLRRSVEGADDNAKGGGEQPETGGTQNDQNGNDADKTFTQAELNAIVQDRLARERKKYDDYDDLKEKAQKYAEIEEAQKSELEKAKERAEQLERERNDALQQANEKLIRSAFVAEAAKLGAEHPEDAYNLASHDAVEVADDGTVTGVADQVQALVDAGRLPTRGKPPAPNLDGGAGSGDRPKGDEPTLSDEEASIAAKLSISPEQYRKAKAAL